MANLLRNLAFTMLAFCFAPCALSRIQLEIAGIMPAIHLEDAEVAPAAEDPQLPACAPAPAPAEIVVNAPSPAPAPLDSAKTDQQHQTSFFSKLKAFLKQTFHVGSDKHEKTEKEKSLMDSHTTEAMPTPVSFVSSSLPSSFSGLTPASPSSPSMDCHGEGSTSPQDGEASAILQNDVEGGQ